MGILGIENRSENWKTAECFCRLNGAQTVNLVQQLGGERRLDPSDVQLELFWRGARDHARDMKRRGKKPERTFPEVCRRLFPDLHDLVANSAARFRGLKKHNYSRSPVHRNNLYRNLVNTEIDILLETPKYLFIGEAKHESGLDANSKYVLVHQLIRQYVMASVLVDIRASEGYPPKSVTPFLVGDDRVRLSKLQQVKFMCGMGWLREANVLEWTDLHRVST